MYLYEPAYNKQQYSLYTFIKSAVHTRPITVFIEAVGRDEVSTFVILSLLLILGESEVIDFFIIKS